MIAHSEELQKYEPFVSALDAAIGLINAYRQIVTEAQFESVMEQENAFGEALDTIPDELL